MNGGDAQMIYGHRIFIEKNSNQIRQPTYSVESEFNKSTIINEAFSIETDVL